MTSNHNHISRDKNPRQFKVTPLFQKINILYNGDERLKYMMSKISGEHNPKNDD